MERLEPRTLLSATLVDGVLTLTGTDGNDVIEVSAGPGAGQVVVLGVEGVGPGTLFTGVNRLVVSAGAGQDQILLGGGMLDALGAALGSHLRGGEGDDLIIGGDGDDVLAGGAGSDFLIGGGGANTADFSDAISGVTVDILAERAVGGDSDMIRHIRHVIGSAYDDVITGDANDNHIDGGDGHDHIRAGGGNDTIVDMLGNNLVEAGGGNDHVTTGLADDTVRGEEGDDVIIDFGGVNVLDGGAGNNQITQHQPEPPDVVDARGTASTAANPIGVELGSDGYVELVGGGSDNCSDYFQFTVEADGTLRLDLTTGDVKDHVMVIVTDSAGNVVASFNSKGSNSAAELAVTPGESYSVQVRSLTKRTSSYSLDVTLNHPAPMLASHHPGKGKHKK